LLRVLVSLGVWTIVHEDSEEQENAARLIGRRGLELFALEISNPPIACAVANGLQKRVSQGSNPRRYGPPQRRSLFDSMSNHIANSVNWLPAIRSSATRTIVAGVIGLPMIRSTVSAIPSAIPATVITMPRR
jgi:hypothetical protein